MSPGLLVTLRITHWNQNTGSLNDMSALDPTQTLVELTMAICDIESVSSNEAKLADEIEQVLATASHLSITRDGNAIVARTNLNLDTRVIIAGHIDTVPVAENLPTRLHHFEREQVIFGRGTVDMKGGIAVMLKLAVELHQPKFDVTWVFYDNEEVAADLNGLGRLASNHPELLTGEFAVLCEPTSAMIRAGVAGLFELKSEPWASRLTPQDRGWVKTPSTHSRSH